MTRKLEYILASIFQNRSLIFWLICLSAACCYAKPYLLHYGLANANATGDDLLPGVAEVYLNKERYKSDEMALYINEQVFSSLYLYAPILITKYLGISIRTIWSVLLVFQIFILPILFARGTLRRKGLMAALIVFTATILMQLQAWNLSLFGYINVPYAAYVALPPLIVALLFVAKFKTGRGALLLGIGTLIHPAMGAYALAITGLFLLLRWQDHRDWKHFLNITAAGIAVLPPILNSAWAQSERVSRPEHLEAIMLWMHGIPWKSPFRWTEVVPHFAAWIPVLAYTIVVLRKTAYRSLLLAASAGAVLLSLSHIAGVLLEIPTLILLSGLRSWTIVAILWAPAFIEFILLRRHQITPVSRFALLGLFLGAIVQAPYGMHLLYSLLFLLSESIRSFVAKRLRTVIFLCIAVVVLLIFSKELIPKALLFPKQMEILIGLCALGISGLGMLKKYRHILSTAFACFVIFVFFGIRVHNNRVELRSNQNQFNVQAWIEKNTPPHEKILITSGNFRSNGRRPVSTIFPEMMYLYNRNRKVFLNDRRKIELLNLPADLLQNRDLRIVYEQLSAAISSLTERDFRNILKYHNAETLVINRDLNFHKIFESGELKVYRIPAKNVL